MNRRGLLSGGMAQSAVLGTGLSAINALPIDEAAKTALAANHLRAYAGEPAKGQIL